MAGIARPLTRPPSHLNPPPRTDLILAAGCRLEDVNDYQHHKRRQEDAASALRDMGAKVTFLQLARAIKLLRAGKDIDYEGAFSPVDFDKNGDIGSAVFEIWKYSAPGKIDTLSTVTFHG